MHNGAQAYARMAQTTANPREREAQLLLRAAARFAAAHAAQPFDRTGARDAAEFNRKLWTVFFSSVNRPENPLDPATKANLRNIALFSMRRSSEIEVNPQPDLLQALIDINRNIAEGLRG